MQPLLLDSLIDQLPVGVIVLDEDARIRSFNRYEERLSGKRREEVLGRDFFDDVAPCTRQIDLESRLRDGLQRRALDLDVEFAFPYPYNRVPRDVRIRAVSVETDGPPATVLLVEDITARRNLERETVGLLARLRGLLHRYVGAPYADALEASASGIIPATDEPAFVLFADLVDFTAFASRVPPAELFGRLNAPMGEAIAAVTGHGGVVDKLLGDGILGWFRPTLHGERALYDALRAANEIQRRAAVRGFRFRVGLASGTVTFGTVGSADFGNVTVLGHTVNLARRLQETANPGEILLSEEVATAAAPVVDVAPVACVLKGIGAARAYRLVDLRLP